MDFDLGKYLDEKENQVRPFISFQPKEYKKIIEDIPIENPVKTISPNWLPLITLEEEFKFNENYRKNIKSLTNKYCCWKKVRGDGNCYYRSVMSSYFTKIFHFNQHPNRIYQLILLLKGYEIENITSEYKESVKKVLKEIEGLYTKFQESMPAKIQVFEKVCNLLQKEDFDLALVATSRVISYLTLNSDKGDSIRPFLTEDEIDSINNRILTMNTEAEGVELSLCPMALDITVNQVNVFDKVIYNTFPVDLEGGQDPSAKVVIDIICKSRGHYDSLYSIKDMEEDDYCIEYMSYACDI